MIEDPPVAVLDVVEGPDEAGEHRGVELDSSGQPLPTEDVLHPHDRRPKIKSKMAPRLIVGATIAERKFAVS